MMATVLRGASVFGAASESGAGFAKMSSNNAKRGASGHAAAMESRKAESPQQTRPEPASRNMATSSAGAWRAYSGTAMSPSAIIARASVAQRMLFGATRA